MTRRIEFFKHSLAECDKQNMRNQLDSLFLTTGSVVKKFEVAFAQMIGTRFAVGVTSCTHALELVLTYFGIGPGDHVITTPLSFVATAHAIEHVGAYPCFVDVDPTTGLIDLDKIQAAITEKTKAIIPVHLYGQMVATDRLKSIADRYKLVVIEDAAHCIEGSYKGSRPGALSDAACFSFYATKNMTCGEGGAIATNNRNMYEWLLMARQHGMSKNAAQRYAKKYEHYDVTFLGKKSNMTNLQASLLIDQLPRLEKNLMRRADIVAQYDAALASLSSVSMPRKILDGVNALHLYTIWVPAYVRDHVLTSFYAAGIGVAVHYLPIHLFQFYRKKYHYQKGDFVQAELIGAQTLSLPLYPGLDDEEVAYVIATLKTIVHNYENKKIKEDNIKCLYS